MTDDGDFPTKSRKVPPADDTRNYYQEEVVGNKTDAAVTSPGTTKSLQAYAKGALNQLSSIITLMGQAIDINQNVVGWCDVDRSARFEISLIDKDSGGIASGDITPGTYTIDRYKNGDISSFADAGLGQITVTVPVAHGFSNGDTVEISGTTNYDGEHVIANVAALTFEITDTWVATETGTWGGWHEIVSSTALSKSTGLVYLDYFFEDTDWATDDNFKITPTGISVVIGGNTYYPSVTTWMGVIQDISTIEGKIDIIDGVVDGIQTDLDNATDGLGALKIEIDANETKIDTVDTVVDAIKAKTDNLNFNAEVTKEVLAESMRLGAQAKVDVNTECDTALTDYDPPTRTEATADKDAIIVEVNANETKIDTVDTVVDAIKLKTDNLPTDPADESLVEAHVTSEVDDIITRIKGLDDIHDDLVIVDGIVDNIQDTGGFGRGMAINEVTFLNKTGTVSLFGVTGDVIVKIIAVVKTNCASVGGCTGEVGIAAGTDAIIATTDITLLAAQEIWHDVTPDSEIELLSTMKEYIITDGNDISLTLSLQADSGAITFYALWTPLSSDGLVAVPV